MAIISGVLKVGEAGATASTIVARQVGSSGSYLAILFGLVGIGLTIGLVTSFASANGGPPNYRLGGTVGCAVGALAFLIARRHIIMARFKRRFQGRGQPLELPLRMEISPEHLLYEVGGVTHIARWNAVDEVFRSHDYWIFLAQANSLFAPRRLFSSAPDEMAFLKEALGLMSEGARERSAEAVQFSGYGRTI